MGQKPVKRIDQMEITRWIYRINNDIIIDDPGDIQQFIIEG